MNYEELLNELDLESYEDFLYFENIADFLESDFEIEVDSAFLLFKDIDKSTIAELINGYLEDVCENMPDSAIDLYTILNTAKLSLCGIAKSCEDEDKSLLLTEELLRFRNWYSVEKRAFCINKENRQENYISVAEALALHRLEKFGGDSFQYDFDDALEYELDEYIVSFSDMYGDDDEEDFENSDDAFMHEEEMDLE